MNEYNLTIQLQSLLNRYNNEMRELKSGKLSQWQYDNYYAAGREDTLKDIIRQLSKLLNIEDELLYLYSHE